MRLSSSRSTAILHRPQQDFLLWDKAGTRPSLDQQFADRKDLVDAISGQQLITFTRASAGTYVGSDGLIKTATTNEARFDHDPTTGESLGLLVEELRSNLLLNSGTLATQDVTVTAVPHTLSFYGSGTVTLSGTHTATVVGTGAYPARTTLTFTPTAGTLTVTVSGTVEYANLEEGSFPTSYIPTTTTTVTRAADMASITGANFSSWIDLNDGTFFSDSEVIASNVQTQVAWSLTGGTYLTSLRQPQSASNKFRAQIGNVFTPSPGTGNLLSDGTTKACVAYSGTAGRLQVGSSSDDATAVGVLDPTQFNVGSLGGASAILNGTIRRLTYWPTRLPNDTLETITQ
jgi:hypothetical protein